MTSADDSARREGRGRLSSIDTLPEEADEDIAWANDALRDRKMPQTEILNQFNARLADKGIKGVSKGAFSRFSVKQAINTRRTDESRRITTAVMRNLKPGDRAGSMIAATELLKHRIVELVMDENELNLGLFNQAALVLQRLSTTAARAAEDQRREQKQLSEAEAKKAAAEKDAEKAKAETEAAADAETVARIATEAGLSADTVAALRRGVLGLAG